jgi:hypothetical protein
VDEDVPPLRLSLLSTSVATVALLSIGTLACPTPSSLKMVPLSMHSVLGSLAPKKSATAQCVLPRPSPHVSFVRLAQVSGLRAHTLSPQAGHTVGVGSSPSVTPGTLQVARSFFPLLCFACSEGPSLPSALAPAACTDSAHAYLAEKLVRSTET